jgi:hypothetical protein
MLTTDDKIGMVRFGFKNIIWDVFDKDMNREFTEMIEDSEDENYRGHVNVGKTIKLFTSVQGKFLFQTFYCYTFDIENNTYTKKELFKSGYTSEDGKPRKIPQYRSIDFAVSPDENYFAFIIDDYRSDRNSYTVRVFNTKDYSLAYKTYYAKDKEKYFEHGHFIVNDAAEVYVLGKTYFDGKKVLQEGKTNYEYTLSKVTKAQTSHLTIPVKKELIHYLQIQDKADQLLLLGTYDRGDKREINGLYTIKVDKMDFKVTSRKAQKTPLQVYKDLYEPSKAEELYQNNSALNNYWFKETLTDSQGNTYLFMHIFTYSDESRRGRRNYRGYNIPDGRIDEVTLDYSQYGLWVRHYRNLLIYKIDNQGKLIWGRALETVNETVASKAFIKEDQLHVLFQGSCNLEPDQDGNVMIKYKIFTKICLYNLVFDTNGEKIYHSYHIRKAFKSPTYEVDQGYFENGIFVMPTPVTLRKRFIKFY